MILLFAAFAIALTSGTTRLVQLSSVCIRLTTSALAAASLQERCRERSRLHASFRPANGRPRAVARVIVTRRPLIARDHSETNCNGSKIGIDWTTKSIVSHNFLPRQIKARMARIVATSKSHRARLASRPL